MQLETRTQKVCAVINADINVNDLDLLASTGITYYAILHDKDTDKDGLVKTKHYHLVLKRSTASRVKWYLNHLVDILGVNQNQVSIMACDNITASVQYLIHQNDKSKYQYAPFDILSNDSVDNVQGYLDIDLTKQELNFDKLEQLCLLTNCNRLAIMREVGLGVYMAYRNTINDFINDYRILLEKDKEERRKELFKKECAKQLGNERI